MMALILLIVVEWVFGVVVGFVLSDNKKGLSIEEAKIFSVLFMISAAVVFWQNPELSGKVFAELALSWFILVTGVLLGEIIKMRLISNIVRTIHKKDIQLAISELVQQAHQVQHTGSPETLYQKLYDVQKMLQGLAAKSKGIQSPAFLRKLYYLFELCEDYVSLSVTLKANSSSDTIDTWMGIGNELTSLSWNTLNHAEENVKNELGKAFNMKVVQKAVTRR